MSAEDLVVDGNGNVILNPVTGFITGPIAEIAILCQVQYVTSDAELQAGKQQKIQFVLTPQQGRELAEALTRHADRISSENTSLPTV